MQQNSPSHLPLNDKDLFLKELRAVTGPAHKQLEEVPISQAIVSPQITLQQYALYLAKMYAFVKPFEQELYPSLENLFKDIHQRKKAQWLEQDLKTLTAMGVQFPSVPFYHFKNNLSPAFLAGAMYVLEGSTLGGKFIYKNIHAALSLNSEHGAVYFSGYGADTGRQWSSFLEELCNYASPENKSEIFRGADETFQMMFELLSR